MKKFDLSMEFLYWYFDAKVIGRKQDQLWQFWYNTDYEAGIFIKKKDVFKYVNNFKLGAGTDIEKHAKKIADIVLTENFGKIDVELFSDGETNIREGFHTIAAYEYLGIMNIPVVSEQKDFILKDYDKFINNNVV